MFISEDDYIEKYITTEFEELRNYIYPQNFWTIKRMRLERNNIKNISPKKKELFQVFYKEIIEHIIDVIDNYGDITWIEKHCDNKYVE